MKIVKATKEDTEKLTRMLKVLDVAGFEFSQKERVEKHIEARMFFLASEGTEDVLGLIGLRINHKSCEIYAIVSEKRGVGKQLIDFAIEKCRNENVPKLWCWSMSQHNAREFYEKMGFEEQYLLKRQWNGEDCYFFGKTIKI